MKLTFFPHRVESQTNELKVVVWSWKINGHFENSWSSRNLCSPTKLIESACLGLSVICVAFFTLVSFFLSTGRSDDLLSLRRRVCDTIEWPPRPVWNPINRKRANKAAGNYCSNVVWRSNFFLSRFNTDQGVRTAELLSLDTSPGFALGPFPAGRALLSFSLGCAIKLSLWIVTGLSRGEFSTRGCCVVKGERGLPHEWIRHWTQCRRTRGPRSLAELTVSCELWRLLGSEHSEVPRES